MNRNFELSVCFYFLILVLFPLLFIDLLSKFCIFKHIQKRGTKKFMSNNKQKIFFSNRKIN